MGGRNKIGFDIWATRAQERGFVLKGVEYISGRARLFLECKKHGDFYTKSFSKHTCRLCANNGISNSQQITWDEFINRAKIKHGDKFVYLDTEWKGIKGKINVICPVHGEFKTVAHNHVIGDGGCKKCVHDAQRKTIDGRRKCTVCGEMKEIKHFHIKFIKKTSKMKMSSCCIYCQREKDKIRSRNQSPEKKRLNARMSQQKKRQSNIIKWLEENQGSFCVAHWYKCPKCSRVKMFRHKEYEKEKCGICLRGEAGIGRVIQRRTLESICPRCKIEHHAKMKECLCASCKSEDRKRSRDNWRHSITQRARKHGVYMEAVSREKVYKRDNYRCAGCGIKVIKSKTYCKEQATLDHIIPLSKGGSHTYDNVRTMCHACNAKKSDKIDQSVQLNMFISV